MAASARCLATGVCNAPMCSAAVCNAALCNDAMCIAAVCNDAVCNADVCAILLCVLLCAGSPEALLGAFCITDSGMLVNCADDWPSHG